MAASGFALAAIQDYFCGHQVIKGRYLVRRGRRREFCGQPACVHEGRFIQPAQPEGELAVPDRQAKLRGQHVPPVGKQGQHLGGSGKSIKAIFSPISKPARIAQGERRLQQLYLLEMMGSPLPR